jgi:hypothetical protein
MSGGAMSQPGSGGGRYQLGFPSRPGRPRPPGSNFGGGRYQPGFGAGINPFDPANRRNPSGMELKPIGDFSYSATPIDGGTPGGLLDSYGMPVAPRPGGTPGGLRDDYGMPLTPGSPPIGSDGMPMLTRKPGAFRGLGFDQDIKRDIRQAYRQGDVRGARNIFRGAGGSRWGQVRGTMDMNMGNVADITDPNYDSGDPVLR